MARPTIFTQEIANEICAGLAEGESLRSICQADHLPNRSTVNEWARTNPTFSDQYAKARMDQASNMADDLLAIADNEDEDPKRSRLRVDTRKWILSKVLPKAYGDKIEHNHQGAINLNIDSELASTL